MVYVYYRIEKITQYYQKEIVEAGKAGWTLSQSNGTDSVDLNDTSEWTLPEAILYSLTVITTIGRTKCA